MRCISLLSVFIFFAPFVAANPAITEFMAVNDETLADEDGDFPDWIEIQNLGAQELDLDGYYLTDNSSNLTKWAFPEHLLCPGCFVVVFASEKNRDDAGEEFHTNFKLSSEGEYLALVAPDGLTVLQEFTPSYPGQFTDVSFGLPSNRTNETILAEGVAAQVFIPSNGLSETSWFQPTFDDSSWLERDTGIGYDRSSNGTNWFVVASAGFEVATNEFSGVQGQDSWFYGYLDVGVDGDDTNYQATPGGVDEFTLFLQSIWTGSAWDWGAGSPWTTIGPTVIHPNDGPEHYTILRYVVEPGVVGAVRLEGLFNNGSTGGNGTTGRLFHNGSEIFSQVTDGTTATFDLTTTVSPGDFIDLMIDTGPTNVDGSDSTTYKLIISDRSDLSEFIAPSGDVESVMYNVNPSAWMRVPFVMDSVFGLQTLDLHMRYNDGFVAYLNGVEVAKVNAPEVVGFNATSVVERVVVDSTQSAIFPINDAIDHLQLGTNILAIQGLNYAVDDDFFLQSPALSLSRLISTNGSTTTEYMVEPTPGAENRSGTTELGPLIVDAAEEVEIITNNTNGLVVSASVIETQLPFAELRAFYRVMFDVEASVVMVDDGTNGDLVSGDQIYTATLPLTALDPGELFRWRYEASDTTGTVSRLPNFDDPLDRDEYFGTIHEDGSIESLLPVMHWFLEDPAAANLRSPGARGAIFYEGEFYDNVQADLHGQSTGGFPKKSYDMDFNRGNRFRWRQGEDRVKDINLISNWADKSKMRNTMAYETVARAGAPHHYAFPIRVEQNGDFFAIADMLEDGDDLSLERNGLDPDGAFYKMFNKLQNVSGGEKKTRKDEGKEDLQGLIDGLTGGTAAEQLTYIYDHVDIAQAANYYAALSTANITDWGHKNYYVYRDTNGTGEWFPITWDVDLSFGHVWVGGYFVDTLFQNVNVNVGAGDNELKRDFYGNPEFYQMFTRRLRTLMDEMLKPPGTPVSNLFYEARFDELADLIDPPTYCGERCRPGLE